MFLWGKPMQRNCYYITYVQLEICGWFSKPTANNFTILQTIPPIYMIWYIWYVLTSRFTTELSTCVEVQRDTCNIAEGFMPSALDLSVLAAMYEQQSSKYLISIIKLRWKIFHFIICRIFVSETIIVSLRQSQINGYN